MDEQEWEEAALGYEWAVPWRLVRRHGNWFVGGYGNVAVNLVDRHLESRADQLALIDRRRTKTLEMTFRDLYWQTAKLARWWSDQGIRSGDRVFVCGEASVVGLVAWLAAARLGAVCVRTLVAADEVLKTRLAASESRWLVCTDDACARQAERIFAPRPSRPQGVGTVPRLLLPSTVRDIIAKATELLDPVPVEANAIGTLIYGDDAEAYAFAGLGAMMGWHQSLMAIFSLSHDDHVGLMSDYGGLSDLLVLTLAVLASGATSVWLDSRRLPPPQTHLPLTKLLCHPLDCPFITEISGSLTQVVILGPERFVSLPGVLSNLALRAYPDMRAGQWALHPPVREDSPSHDRSRAERPGRAEESDQWIADNTWVAEVLAVPGVKEALVTRSPSGELVLWACGKQPGDDITALQERIRNVLATALDNLRVVVLPEFPETVEGGVAHQVLRAVADNATAITVGHLRNPQALESLVRAIKHPPMAEQ